MSNELLSYEEYKVKFPVEVSDILIDDLQQLHGLDAHLEVESLQKAEYDSYVKESNTKQ